MAELQNANKHCILITSGAVAFGKQRLAQEIMLSKSMRDTIQSNTKEEDAVQINNLKKPNAAVGQSGLQALYETMFRNYGIIVAQVLVTTPDFYNDHTRDHLLQTMDELLKLNIIPIINTNDAISALPVTDAIMSRGGRLPITDNDSLAANLAVATKADLCVLMSDVEGIYDAPPNKQGEARVLHTFNPEDKEKVEFGEKSLTGTGGMESKVDSALWALERGVPSVICNGMGHNTLRKIMGGRREGTFFTTADTDVMPVEVLAKNGNY